VKEIFKEILFFKRKDKTRIAIAKQVIEKMGSLRCRPMLLAHIEELMENREKFSGLMHEYDVYEILIDNWLAREQIKSGIPKEELLKVCLWLAVGMQKKQAREISRQDLRELVASCPGIEQVENINVEGRSLLNKNSNGDYRFSHYSIQEFLVAKYIRETGRSPAACRVVSMVSQKDSPWQLIFCLPYTTIKPR
jgi:hypothetical protein